ncbi:hypothetical protein EC988_007513, partial [Linderina pennispora]
EESSDNKRKASSEEDEAEEDASTKRPKSDDAESTTTVFTANLPFGLDDETLKQSFADFGSVTDAYVARLPNGRARGFGYVDFTTTEERDSALNAGAIEIEGREVRIEESNKTATAHRARAEADAQRQESEPSTTLFIGNLSFQSSEDSIRAAFAECGTITDIRLATDRDTGRPKGFGHIQFSTVEEAQEAMKWNQSELDGRTIRLDYAQGRQGGGDRGGRGGFGGRGGRGGFGGGRGGFGGRGGGRGGFGGRGGGRGGFGGRGGGRGGFGGRGGGRGGFGGGRGGYSRDAAPSGNKITFD